MTSIAAPMEDLRKQARKAGWLYLLAGVPAPFARDPWMTVNFNVQFFGIRCPGRGSLRAPHL